MSTAAMAADLPAPEILLNPMVLDRVPGAAISRRPLSVHSRLPGYQPTRLLAAPDIAARLGVANVWVKDESWRLGLPAFKMLGASYATYLALVDRLGAEPDWNDVDELRAAVAGLAPMRLAAATDGNHGRAVARMAKLLGFASSIYVPEGTVAARIRAIESEGASVTTVDGDYDVAIARSAEDASEDCLVISDTSWPGYVDTPTRVAEGYSTVFAEVSDELAGRGVAEPDVVVIPVGVGAFASAAVHHYKSQDGSGPTPSLVGVEPATANCVLESIRAEHLVTVPGPHASIMAGLNCGTPSQIAWPLVSRGLDAVIAVTDEWTELAMRELADVGVVSGETGAASLAGVSAVHQSSQTPQTWAALGLHPDASVLLLSTEGATDPESWERIVGREVPTTNEPTP
jgi:diaminopropionate ammonia-lyase